MEFNKKKLFRVEHFITNHLYCFLKINLLIGCTILVKPEEHYYITERCNNYMTCDKKKQNNNN